MVISQFLTFEASLPKTAGTFVFQITTSRDRFGQRSHPPRNIAETAPRLLASSRRHKQLQFTFGWNGCCLVLVLFKREKLPPTSSDRLVRPTSNDIWPIAKDDVNMVDHHGKGQAVNTEAGREFLQSILDPNPTMFE